MRRRLVVALLDTSHDGRADAALRGEILLQDSAPFSPGLKLLAHPGHYFRALAADAVTGRFEAFSGMSLAFGTGYVGHKLPSH